MSADTDTIFALASGGGRAAIAIIRISGAASRGTVLALARRLPAPRRASVARLCTEAGVTLDHAMLIWLPGPRSYTGEDSAELHLHGGHAVLRAVMAELVTLGCRPAEAGEFSRRAVMNGRLDVLEAEGIADLITAETEAQRLQALKQLEGQASRLLADWTERLTRLLAWQEALIDFPEEDLSEASEAQFMADLHVLAKEIEGAAAGSIAAARVREGLVFAIIGPPNVGKSSLLNALAEREVAMVSALPGTTRDPLEARLDLAGLLVTLVDTAGLREATDPLEAEGVRRALERAEAADLLIYVGDASAIEAASPPPASLCVANKIDLASPPPDWHGVSAVTGLGVSTLRDRLQAEALRLTNSGGSHVLSQMRHIAVLKEAAAALKAASLSDLVETRGEELRLAWRALGRISGKLDVEDLLETVFSTFCIGK